MRNITSKCPHDEFCGGCVYQGLEYRKQLEIKEGEVHSLYMYHPYNFLFP